MGETGSREPPGWNKQISPGHCGLRVGHAGGGRIPGKVASTCRLCRRTVAAVHPAFAPEPRDSGLPRTSLALPEPRASARSRCVCGSSAFRLTQTAGIPPDFHSQFLWGRLLLALELWAGEPQGGAGAPCFSRGTSAAKVYLPMPSHRMWLWDRPVSHLCPSPQSDVASSLHPQSRQFGGSVQLVSSFSGRLILVIRLQF